MPKDDLRKAVAITRELERRARYRVSPEEWMVERLGIKREHIDWSLIPAYKGHIWDGTPNPIKLILDSLAQSQWVAVEGATGVSKTFIAACIVLWFLESFEDSLVVTTAPKADQLSLHIWKEIGELHPKFGRGELTTRKLRMDPPNDDWIAVGFTAGVKASEVSASATKAQGFHAEHMLIVVEETPGVGSAVMTAFQNTSIAPHNLILALGNPDHQLDSLHQFGLLKRVVPIRISGFDHPNVVLKDPSFIPGAQSEQGLADMLDRYKGNRDNPLYLSRARGISPAQATDSLIRLEWLYAARDRAQAYKDPDGAWDHEELQKVVGLRALGVDVANSEEGDKGAIAEGLGPVLLEIQSFPCPNANELGGKVDLLMRQKQIKPEYVGVDGTGVGAGTINELKRLKREVVNILSAEKPIETMKDGVKLTEEFDNLRSQMWWQARRDLEDPASDVCLPDDPELFADLVTPRWTVRGNRIIVESKEQLKKRLGRSPDKGDGFVYWNWVRSRRQVKAASAGLSPKAAQAQIERLKREEVESKRALTPDRRKLPTQLRSRRQRSF